MEESGSFSANQEYFTLLRHRPAERQHEAFLNPDWGWFLLLLSCSAGQSREWSIKGLNLAAVNVEGKTPADFSDGKQGMKRPESTKHGDAKVHVPRRLTPKDFIATLRMLRTAQDEANIGPQMHCGRSSLFLTPSWLRFPTGFLSGAPASQFSWLSWSAEVR